MLRPEPHAAASASSDRRLTERPHALDFQNSAKNHLKLASHGEKGIPEVRTELGASASDSQTDNRFSPNRALRPIGNLGGEKANQNPASSSATQSSNAHRRKNARPPRSTEGTFVSEWGSPARIGPLGGFPIQSPTSTRTRRHPGMVACATLSAPKGKIPAAADESSENPTPSRKKG